MQIPVDFDVIRQQLATDGRVLRARARVEKVLGEVRRYHQLSTQRKTGTVTTEMPDSLKNKHERAQQAFRAAESAAFLRVKPRLDAARVALIDDIADRWAEVNALQAQLLQHEALTNTVAPLRDRVATVALSGGDLSRAGWLQRARPAPRNTGRMNDERSVLQQLGALLSGTDNDHAETETTA